MTFLAAAYPGDPTLLGWVVTGGYALAAALCWRRERGEGRMGLWVGAVMLALALNKQLDLHNQLTLFLRGLARAQGWYTERRVLQARFVVAVGATLAATMGAMLWLLRRRLREHALLVIGLGILLGFVAVRAASFHHVDLWFRDEAFGVRHRHAVELAGITCVALWAMKARRAQDNLSS